MGSLMDLYKLGLDLVDGQRETRKEIFDLHIDPMFKEIKKAHEDYIRSFTDLYNTLSNQATPSKEIIDFLWERKYECNAQRVLAKELAEKLREKKIGSFSHGLEDEISDFCSAVMKYFESSSSMGDISWYTRFIETVEDRAKYDDSLIWKSMAISGEPDEYLLEEVKLILRSELPKSYKNVLEKYATLKSKII